MKKPKPDPGVEIDSEKYFKAQSRWCMFWKQQNVKIPNFGNFLGMSNGPLLHQRKPNRMYTLKIRASAARKVEKLTSPYHYTFLKAYQIRKHDK